LPPSLFYTLKAHPFADHTVRIAETVLAKRLETTDVEAISE
jgi:hypothetical protein